MNHRDDHDIPCNTHLTIGFKFCDQQICDGYFFGEGLAIFSVVVCEILLKKIMHLTKNQAQKIIKNFQQFLLNQEYDKLLLDDLNMFAPLVHSNQIDAAMMPVKIILEGLN
ncbi:hypothetical protein [Mycoplasmoides fastidiosum]|nr:hypothetical protein [Mycoplasmoides fastidiosum]UUD37331.1 hypothetical protein NPA10_01980 [Mycoplasmoides fastidiosum]